MGMLLEAIQALNLLASLKASRELEEAKKGPSLKDQLAAQQDAEDKAAAERKARVIAAKKHTAAAQAEIASQKPGFKADGDDAVHPEISATRRNAIDKSNPVSKSLAALAAASAARHAETTKKIEAEKPVKGKTGPKPKAKVDAPEVHVAAPAATPVAEPATPPVERTTRGAIKKPTPVPTTRKVKLKTGREIKLHVNKDLTPKQKLHNMQTMHGVHSEVARELRKQADTYHDPGTPKWHELHTQAASADARAKAHYHAIHKHLAAHV